MHNLKNLIFFHRRILNTLNLKYKKYPKILANHIEKIRGTNVHLYINIPAKIFAFSYP